MTRDTSQSEVFRKDVASVTMDLNSTILIGVGVFLIGGGLFFLIVRDKVTKSVVALKKDDEIQHKKKKQANQAKQTDQNKPQINVKPKDKALVQDFKESNHCISKFSAHTGLN